MATKTRIYFAENTSKVVSCSRLPRESFRRTLRGNIFNSWLVQLLLPRYSLASWSEARNPVVGWERKSKGFWSESRRQVELIQISWSCLHNLTFCFMFHNYQLANEPCLIDSALSWLPIPTFGRNAGRSRLHDILLGWSWDWKSEPNMKRREKLLLISISSIR